jgi:hypothetical protein
MRSEGRKGGAEGVGLEEAGPLHSLDLRREGGGGGGRGGRRKRVKEEGDGGIGLVRRRDGAPEGTGLLGDFSNLNLNGFLPGREGRGRKVLEGSKDMPGAE